MLATASLDLSSTTHLASLSPKSLQNLYDKAKNENKPLPITPKDINLRIGRQNRSVKVREWEFSPSELTNVDDAKKKEIEDKYKSLEDRYLNILNKINTTTKNILADFPINENLNENIFNKKLKTKVGNKIFKKFPDLDLGELNDKRATSSLITALNDENFEVQKNAAYALGRLEDEKAIDPLRIMLESTEIIKEPSWALTRILKTKKAISTLMEVFRKKKERKKTSRLLRNC